MTATKLPSVGWISGAGVKTSFELASIYDLLEVIRTRCGLFTGEKSITALWHYIHGFKDGLIAVDQGLPDGTPPFHGFHAWIAARCGFVASTSGWNDMLLNLSGGDEALAFDKFFIELDLFRRQQT